MERRYVQRTIHDHDMHVLKSQYICNLISISLDLAVFVSARIHQPMITINMHVHDHNACYAINILIAIQLRGFGAWNIEIGHIMYIKEY